MRYQRFRNEALAAPIVSPSVPLALFSMADTVDGNNDIDRDLIRKVCLSHERMREELAGAQKVIEVMDRKQRHGCTDAFCKECDQ